MPEEIRRGGKKVYNPYEVLLLFDEREFKPHWFAIDQLGFLYQLLIEQNMSTTQLETLITDEEPVSGFGMKDIAVGSLLFQTGYLAISETEQALAQMRECGQVPGPERTGPSGGTGLRLEGTQCAIHPCRKELNSGTVRIA